MIVFITGGAKNGKSSLAQKIALKLAQGGTHYYIATMIPCDEEDRERIRLHLLDRAGLGFETLECGRDIGRCLEMGDPKGTFLLDSVTALLLNELFPDPTACDMDMQAADRCQKGLEKLCDGAANIVFVSDYIYSDAAKYDDVTENYRKSLAQLDRYLAKRADTVIEVSAASLIFHKGGLLE